MNKNMTFDSMMTDTVHCSEIFNRLFFLHDTPTSAELAQILDTTTNSVRSRISEIRNLGYTVRCVTQDGKNFHYEADQPTPEEVSCARRMGLAGFYNPSPFRANKED